MSRRPVRRMIQAGRVIMFMINVALGLLLTAGVEQHDTARPPRYSPEVLATATRMEQVVVDAATVRPGFVITRTASTSEVGAQPDRPVRSPLQASQVRWVMPASHPRVHDQPVPVAGAAPGMVIMPDGGHRVSGLRPGPESIVTAGNPLPQPVTARGKGFQAAADRSVIALIPLVVVIAIIAGLTGSALAVILITGYLTRFVVRPVRRAAVMADHLAGGDLGSRMPETRVCEISRLDRWFNIMGGSLEQSLDELAQLVETQTALRRIATLVAHGAAPAEVLDAVAAELGRLIGTDAAHIVHFEADGTETVVAAWGMPELLLPVGTRLSLEGRSVSSQVFNSGRPARMDTYEDVPGPIAAHLREHGVRSALGAPIYVEGQLWGAVTATMTRGEPPAPDAEARLADHTDLIGTAIANAQARAELIASRARVVVAADQTRRQIERDLHDGIQQRLVSLGLDVRTAEAGVPTDMSEVRAQLCAIANGLTGALDDLREISRGIHPAILSEGGLGPALKALARRSPVTAELDLHLEGRLPEPVEVAAYYVVAEALANAAKHAHASLVRVDAEINDGWLHLSVRDNGVGGADPARGSGLTGLADRVEALGGTMTLNSQGGHGTTLRVDLPLVGDRPQLIEDRPPLARFRPDGGQPPA